MKALLTVGLVLATLFASTFLVMNSTGVLTLERVETLLKNAAEARALYVALAVVLLLAADLFIAVPTLTIVILAGYFLGFAAGAASAVTGMAVAGFSGYGLCRRYGPGLLLRIYHDPEELRRMKTRYDQHGPIMLVICRAMPILPEVSCCLSGANRMPFARFALCFALGTIPYATIAAYAGSRSSLDDPQPAVVAAVGMSLCLWAAWWYLWRTMGHRLSESS